MTENLIRNIGSNAPKAGVAFFRRRFRHCVLPRSCQFYPLRRRCSGNISLPLFGIFDTFIDSARIPLHRNECSKSLKMVTTICTKVFHTKKELFLSVPKLGVGSLFPSTEKFRFEFLDSCNFLFFFNPVQQIRIIFGSLFDWFIDLRQHEISQLRSSTCLKINWAKLINLAYKLVLLSL